MSIWAAAGYIIAVALGAFAAVFGRMAYRVQRDARKHPLQLPLPPMKSTVNDKEESEIHAMV